MPRELIHWHVVDGVIEQLRRVDPLLATLLHKYRHHAYLGAILHDAPYFFAFGKSEEAQQVAEALHGKDGEDTFRPLYNLSETIHKLPAGELTDSLLAVLYGMFSHAVVDMHFHPLIIYLTGDYYHPDPVERTRIRAKHRLFEVYLDSYCHSALKPNCPRRLKSIIKRINATDTTTLERSLAVVATAIGSAKLWHRSVKDMALCQSLFLQTGMGVIMRLLATISPQRFSEFDALFSFGRHRAPRTFFEPIAYRNPVSGEHFCHTISQLLEQSIVVATETIVQVKNRDQGQPGGSLSFGIVGAKTTEASYFDS